MLNHPNLICDEYFRKTTDLIFFFISNFEKVGLEATETVAVMVENRPEFVFITLEFPKAELKPAFINTTNKRKPLSHSLETSTCKH